MDDRTIAFHRLANQQIARQRSADINALSVYLGAVQAQDASMAKWAFGSRIASLLEGDFDNAFNAGRLIRTHVMRPTWHIVPADDLGWMLDISAPSLKNLLKTRHAELGLTPALIDTCFGLFEKALSGASHLTKEELTSELAKHKVVVDNQQMYHLTFLAEIEKLVCSGVLKQKKHSYALYGERISDKGKLPRAEAIYRLARTYFSSRGPASLKDFCWWSGLGQREAALAQELVGQGFGSFSREGLTYIYPETGFEGAGQSDSVLLLPAFDEFIICYANRSAVITQKEMARVISSNGIFRPILVVQGEVVGIWKREIKKEVLRLTVLPFKPLSKKQEAICKQQAKRLGQFYGKQIEVIA